MKREPHLLGAFLRNLFREKNWQQQLDRHQIFLVWQDVVGKEIAAHAVPDLIRGKVLWLKVSDSIWMQQLHLEKRNLLAAINERLEKEELQDIRFRLETSLLQEPESMRSRHPLAEKRADAEQSKYFEELIAPLGDTELQATMRRLWSKSRERQP
jgi:predicted nucleic acid-binding Zn ribbon protein